MSLVHGFLHGVVNSLTFSSPPLFRYPYRNSMEAFRGDWKQIGGDIESATQAFRGLSEQMRAQQAQSTPERGHE